MSHSYMTCMDENCEIAPCVDRRMAEHQKSNLQARVRELESEKDSWAVYFEKEHEENARLVVELESSKHCYKLLEEHREKLQRLVDMNQKAVDAARRYLDLCTGADSDELQGLLALKEALRDLDGGNVAACVAHGIGD